jgi:hypothetical protein
MTTLNPADLYERHRELLERAIAAVGSREYWSPFPESPSKSIYGETAAADGDAAFRAHLGKPFPIEVPGARDQVATERSPYGLPAGVTSARTGAPASPWRSCAASTPAASRSRTPCSTPPGSRS